MNLAAASLLAFVALSQATYDTVTITETKTIATCAESCLASATVTVNICTSVPGSVSLPFTTLSSSTEESTALPVSTSSPCTNPYGCQHTLLPSGTCKYGDYGCGGETTTKVTRRVTQTDTVTVTKHHSTAYQVTTPSAENSYPVSTDEYPSPSDSYPVESSMQAETTSEQDTTPAYTSTRSTALPATQSYPLTSSVHTPCGPSSNNHPTYALSNTTAPYGTQSPWSSGVTTEGTAEPTYATSSSDEYPLPTYSEPDETYTAPTSAESTAEATSYPAPTTSTEEYYPPPPPAETSSSGDDYYPPPPAEQTSSSQDDYYPPPTGPSDKWPTSTIPISAESTVDAIMHSSTESYYPPPTTMVTSSSSSKSAPGYSSSSSGGDYYPPPPPMTYEEPPSYQFKAARRL